MPLRRNARHFEIIDLSGFFNNDGISYDANRGDGDFDSWEKTFPAEELPESESIFEHEHVPFWFPDKSDGKGNNLALCGNCVAVPPRCYARIFVIGASENGSFKDTLTLHYADGIPEKRELALSEFFCQDSFFNDAPALACSHYHTPEGDVSYFEIPGFRKTRIKPHLWMQKIELNEQRGLRQIEFPDNPSMHIFCLTMQGARGGG